MIYFVQLFLCMLFFGGCTSSNSNSAASKPKEPVTAEASDDVEESDDYDSAEEGEASNQKSKINPKLAAQLAKIYKVDFSFDKLMKTIAKSTSAIPNDYSIYTYDLEYDFFSDNNPVPGMQVDVIAKGGEKYYAVKNKAKSRIKKHFFTGTRTKSGYCGACFFEFDQMNLLLGIAFYEKPGPSSGFFTTSVKFLRGKGNKTHILVGASSKWATDYKVTGFTVKKDAFELLYMDKKSNLTRLVVKLNSTLDTEAFVKKKGDKNFQLVARLFGGALPEFAAKTK
jgi:hypothetical protein